MVTIRSLFRWEPKGSWKWPSWWHAGGSCGLWYAEEHAGAAVSAEGSLIEEAKCKLGTDRGDLMTWRHRIGAVKLA